MQQGNGYAEHCTGGRVEQGSVLRLQCQQAQRGGPCQCSDGSAAGAGFAALHPGQQQQAATEQRGGKGDAWRQAESGELRHRHGSRRQQQQQEVQGEQAQSSRRCAHAAQYVQNEQLCADERQHGAAEEGGDCIKQAARHVGLGLGRRWLLV